MTEVYNVLGEKHMLQQRFRALQSVHPKKKKKERNNKRANKNPGLQAVVGVCAALSVQVCGDARGFRASEATTHVARTVRSSLI